MNPIVRKSEIKLEELCRTCLSKEIELVSVFDVCLGAVTLDHVIATITGVKIELGDGLPTTICRDCREKAANAFEFKSRTVEADGALRGLYSVVKSEEVTLNTILESNSVDVKIEESAHDSNDDCANFDFNVAAEEPCDDADVVQDEGGADGGGGAGADGDTDCPVCGKRYADAAGLTRHVWHRHADIMGPKKRGRPKQLVTSTVLSQLARRGHGAQGSGGGAHGSHGVGSSRRASRRPRERDCLVACAVCRLVLTSKRHLARHMASHDALKVLSCVQCKKMYLRERDFQLHDCHLRGDAAPQQENEGPGEEVQLKPLHFASELQLKDLLERRKEMNGEEGEEAGEGGEEEAALQVCGACGGVFLSAAALAAHRDADHPDQSLRCSHCQKVFQSARGAARHRQQCARVERCHRCDTCGERFQHAISLNKHILRHHAGTPVAVHRKDAKLGRAKSKSEQCFECEVCHKKFHRRSNLKSHMRTHEARGGRGAEGGAGGAGGAGGGSAGLCLYCGRSFSNSSNLIVHMRRHTGEKPYKCEFCGKGFPRSSDLQCHRRSHTGEKPCVCGVCGKGFSRSNKLSRHMRVHTGLKPYKCTYCERAFSQSNDLTLHVRRHTGDKPYVCELCGDRFIQGTALHNHRRAHGHYPPQAAPPPAQPPPPAPAAAPAPLYPPPALAN